MPTSNSPDGIVYWPDGEEGQVDFKNAFGFTYELIGPQKIRNKIWDSKLNSIEGAIEDITRW